jgi:hypothetical protein
MGQRKAPQLSKMKPETRVVWGPGAFDHLPETVRDLIAEARQVGRDIELLCEHRRVGEFELRIRIVPAGTPRVLDLPPIAIVSD